MKDAQIIRVECECLSPEHSFRFMYFPIEFRNGHKVKALNPEIYLSVSLISEYGGWLSTFWWRLKNAVKYLFGFKSMYGMYGETVLNSEDVAEIQKWLERWERHCIEAQQEEVNAWSQKVLKNGD